MYQNYHRTPHLSIGLPIEACTSDVVLIDEDDRVFYETYNIDSDVYLITGNIKHYPNEKRIIKPADFLNRILDVDLSGAIGST